mmetsp:Transcript_20996/g.35050  ORF Transcript_20996/g.35050 Transcript_20996/m.35050 type:complete len:249 (-) Transcript_20996:161-907(-)
MQGIRVGVETLHLIEDHTFEGQRVIFLLNFIVPTLLCQHQGVVHRTRKEHRIHVDVDQVVEILEVAAGHWIAGAVRERHGVQEGLQTGLHEFNEWLLHRILPTAAEHRMLQDVRDAIGVLRRRAEDHAEGLVLVRGLHHGQQLGACFVVLEQVAGAAKLLHILNTGAGPAVELLANLVSLCGSFSHCGGLHGHTLWLGFCLQRSHTSSLQPLSHLGPWHRLPRCSGNPARCAAAGRSPSSAQHEHLQR